eukprot:4692240-Pyramimonas_sp.AAC.1
MQHPRALAGQRTHGTGIPESLPDRARLHEPAVAEGAPTQTSERDAALKARCCLGKVQKTLPPPIPVCDLDAPPRPADGVIGAR